jgi:hypothetical protein
MCYFLYRNRCMFTNYMYFLIYKKWVCPHIAFENQVCVHTYFRNLKYAKIPYSLWDTNIGVLTPGGTKIRHIYQSHASHTYINHIHLIHIHLSTTYTSQNLQIKNQITRTQDFTIVFTITNNSQESHTHTLHKHHEQSTRKERGRCIIEEQKTLWVGQPAPPHSHRLARQPAPSDSVPACAVVELGVDGRPHTHASGSTLLSGLYTPSWPGSREERRRGAVRDEEEIMGG